MPRMVGATAVLIVVLVAVILSASNRPTAPSGQASPTSPVTAVTELADPVVLPSPEPSGLPATEPAPSVTDPDGWTIAVAATGYQAELDACQWVRMDLGAAAPIAGAHTSCGGSVVLQIAIGDRVGVVGQNLDGDYLVTEARDAHAGDVAATATEGMSADLLLQSCYPGPGGRVRLLALRLAEG